MKITMEVWAVKGMISFVLSLLALACVKASVAAEPQPQPKYCVTAVGFMTSREAGVKALESCKGGDVISVPNDEVAVIARYCDLSSAIVSGIHGSVICTLRGVPLGQRATQ
jgi:hypothetical protein